MAPPGELPEHALVFVDPNERRRLQNRIAQRRYRQRHKESQKPQGQHHAEETDDNISNASNISDSYGHIDYNTNIASGANDGATPSAGTKAGKKRSKSTLQREGFSPVPNPPQLPKGFVTSDGRLSWDPGAIDPSLDDLQTGGYQQLQVQEPQYRPVPHQSFQEQRCEEYKLQAPSPHPSYAYQNEQLYLARPVPQRQKTSSAARHDDSPYLNDQMSLYGRHGQAASEVEYGALSPYAESLEPPPSLYMNSSVSGSASPFDASYMDPVLLGSLPPDDSLFEGIGHSVLQQAGNEEKWSTAGGTKGEVSNAVSGGHEYANDTADARHPGRRETRATSSHGGTALHRAVFCGHERVVETLLEGGANTETRNRQGRTALHLAALSGKDRLMRILLEHGANPQACTDTGQTSLHLVTQKDEQAMAKLLLKAHVLRRQCPHSQGLGCVRANVNAADDRGWTPLHIASKDGHQGMVKLLVENGADLEQRDLEGSTALHHASVEGRELVVKLLLQLGADISS
ncbi:ankyrin repeat-containing domain protein [Amylocarpus encephaloides]|uniref:Ankyrin repeat-containing domain protein n=1 Tax=Amylocarpus encephaloides TaxID=45428 RepID=A0A9P8C611_9HELO|nr:ankyrin repeat-containing domain protein [Amylocarpus encephaloides]